MFAVFFFGRVLYKITEAGKSTTIHFLAGSTMKQDPNNGSIFPINVQAEDLKQIATKQNATESVTRFVSSTSLNLKAAEAKQYGENVKNEIELCDTPGFNDSKGPEIDVSNGLGVVKAVSLAESVKVLLVISTADIDGRMRGPKDLEDTIAKLISDFSTCYDNE